MTKRFLFTAIICISIKFVAAQQAYIDSLKNEISITKNDTTHLLLLEQIANIYSEINPDSAYHYAVKILALTKKLQLRIEEVVALGEMGYAQLNLGNYPRSLQHILAAIDIAADEQSEKNLLPAHFPATDDYTDRSIPPHMQRLTKLSRIMQYAGILYGNSLNYEKSLYYLKAAIPLAEQSNNLRVLSITYTTLGRTYSTLKKQDSALLSLQRAYDYALKADYKRYVGSILLNMGRVYMVMGKPVLAKEYYTKALIACAEQDYFRGVVASNLVLADIYKQSGQPDSSLYFINNGLAVANNLNAPDLFLRSYTALADFYKRAGNNDSTVKYQSLIININDSLFNTKQVQQFQNIDFDAQQQQLEIQTAKKDYQNRLQMYMLLGVLTIILLVAVFLWRSNRHRQKSNALLQKKNTEIEQAMAVLKSTQYQLIQSEKMASLGELTAGIAHEIQNPLNFVNNFSEVSREMLDEWRSERSKVKSEKAEGTGDDIINDVILNLEKILHHGKRADAIVKGMLQHSRSNTGEKESTDINALADKWLRLAYFACLSGRQGMKGNDNSFDVTLKTDFDPSIGNISIIPQDIGRVLLNLYNNALYVVTEKKKSDPAFNPEIILSTRREVGKVLIVVKDNGNGIPERLMDKIFQPFFTTKPTGQGTGLGLSLAYDIVKAHGGEIKVNNNPGYGAEFIISLPINS